MVKGLQKIIYDAYFPAPNGKDNSRKAASAIEEAITLCHSIECQRGMALKRVEGVLTTELTNCPVCSGKGWLLK